MPIRINLLAEAQSAEDLRRRDPVKRALMASGVVVALVLFWCLTIQGRILQANSEFKGQESHWRSIEKRHTDVTENLKKSAEIERNLSALERVSTNRFLMGSFLNSMQQTMVDQVQAVRLKTDQTFALIDATPAKTNSSRITPGKPPAAIERIGVTIEAKDWNPGDQNYNKFKESIARFPAFQTNLAKSDALRLTSLSKPSFDPGDPTHPFVTFTLEIQFPEVRRE